ncbi:MAG: P-loop NTPase [Treponemataceae bacterium]
MSECSQNCSSCNKDCNDRNFHENPHEKSKIKKVIAVVSGKGGVGKSIVTSMLSVLSQRKNFTTAILDADITGPSIPKAFNIHERAMGNEQGLFPAKTKTGIQIMSLNMMLENETDPVVWRGPVIAGAVKQFWTDVIWENIDYMFIDMPPGTGDVPLTVFQSIPVDGIIIVTSPQELVGMIVDKAVKMAEMMKIKVLGIVENMSYLECPDCGKKIEVFGKSRVEEVAKKHGIKTWSALPINPNLANLVDGGSIEDFEGEWLDNMSKMLEKI